MDRTYVLAPPYGGREPYIFISYSHRDADRVFPLLRVLSDRGFRFWYDEGIDPGTEWPESIAAHLEGCAVCLAMLSENSLASTNCRREVNFAVSRNKPFLSVALEPVKMSPGMELQISSYQSLLKYKYPDEGVFLDRLTELELLQPCRVLPPKPEPTAPEPMSEPVPEPTAHLEAEKREPKPKREKPVRSGKKKGLKLLLPILAAALVLAVVLILLTRPRAAVIGDKQITDSFSVVLRDQSLSGKDVEALGRLKSCRYLTLRGCAFDPGAAEKLGGLKALKGLELTDCTGLSTLRFCESMTELRSLTLLRCGVTDALWSTARLPEALRTLDLGGNALTDPGFPTGLTSLHLEDNRLSSADCLRELTKLESLDLSGNPLADVLGLAGLTQLRTLDLHAAGLTGAAGLENLTKLKELDLGGNAIEDLRPLEALVYLETLDLSGNPISDTLPLGNLSLLKKADLSFCGKLTKSDLVFLSRSAGTLDWLNLSGIGLYEADFLSSCTELTALLVQDCGLSDLEPLRGMTKLQVLNAEGNRIADLSPLAGCAALETVDLAGNRLTGVEGFPAAPETAEGSRGKDLVLLLGGNRIADLSGLDTDYYYRFLDLRGLEEGTLVPPDLQGWHLSLSDLPEQDPETLKGFLSVYVLEKDLSRQAEWETALGSKLAWATTDDLLALLDSLNLYDRLWPWYNSEE